MQIKWNRKALLQLDQASDYIAEQSIQNAEKVVMSIQKRTVQAAENPERFSPDKFKTRNDGSFRAFETHTFRVVYRIYKNHIRVLKVLYSRMKPLYY